MSRAPATSLPSTRPRPSHRLRGLFLGAALGVLSGCLWAAPARAGAGPAGHDDVADAHAPDPGWGDAASAARAVAVARPNLRLGLAYDFGHVDETSTVFVGPVSTTSLELNEVEGHSFSGALIGTVPLVAWTGLRASVRGGTTKARRSLDALEPGGSRSEAYGALVELFARDPRLGSIAVGAGFDRLEGKSGVAGNQLSGSADLQIFFPDLGSGSLDWFTRFEFRHRELEGHGQPFDVDADVYHVTGGARWYASADVAVVFTGTWQRVEEEFFSEDDRTGSLGLHWRLPLRIGPASVEVFAAGSAGTSEYKESPLRGDHRLVYGGRAGFTLRLFSGRSLIESMRQYD